MHVVIFYFLWKSWIMRFICRNPNRCRCYFLYFHSLVRSFVRLATMSNAQLPFKPFLGCQSGHCRHGSDKLVINVLELVCPVVFVKRVVPLRIWTRWPPPSHLVVLSVSLMTLSYFSCVVGGHNTVSNWRLVLLGNGGWAGRPGVGLIFINTQAPEYLWPTSLLQTTTSMPSVTTKNWYIRQMGHRHISTEGSFNVNKGHTAY